LVGPAAFDETVNQATPSWKYQLNPAVFAGTCHCAPLFLKFSESAWDPVNALQLQLPEEEIKGVYEPGAAYEFYRDLSSLIETAIHDIFIVDAYVSEKIFNLYVDKVPPNVLVRILSNKIGPNVKTVTTKYTKRRPLSCELAPKYMTVRSSLTGVAGLTVSR
jgi:hypothetical protein